MAKSRKAAGKPIKNLKSKKSLGKAEAESVRGGRKAGEGQKDFLKVTLKEVMIT